MRRRRYNGYHGRITGRDIFRLATAVLVIVLVLAAVGLMIGQRYLIYTDDGVRLELPFFNREAGRREDISISAQVVQLPRTEPEFSVEEQLPGSKE